MGENLDKFTKRQWSEINKWYNNHDEKVLNIICEPYQSLNIIYKLIIDKIKINEKILYVGKIKKHLKIFENYDGIIDFCDFNNIFKVRGEYDLIVYDDISFYYNRIELEEKEDIAYLIRRTKKIIICSIEVMLNNVNVLEISNLKKQRHFLEPRVITTRLDLTNSMPYVLYDYLRWFNKEGRMVIIYVPNKYKGEVIFKYYTNTLSLEKDIYILQSKEKELLNDINRLKFKDKSSIIITDKLHEYIDDIKDIDIICYFSDDKFFDYKKIIFTCGALTKNYTNERELLLICNEESKNIEQCKSISRRFNKFIWEQRSKIL